MSQASIVPEKLDPGRVRDEFVKGLGPRIRALRKQRSITQLEFAQKMGVPRTYISKVEMSRAIPTLSTLLRIADALGMNVDELLSEERRRRNQEIAAIFVDEFLGEIAKYAGALTPLQKVLIIRAVRRAAQHEKE